MEKPGEPGETSHPCLVLGWNAIREDQFSVLVVFGTSKLEKFNRGDNFVVSNYNAMRQAGLNCETLFDLGRFKWLVWSDRWFHSPDTRRWDTPVIGKITHPGDEVLRYLLQDREARGLPVPPRVRPQIVASNPSTDG